MASRKRQSHNMGASTGRQGRGAVGQGRKGRAALSGARSGHTVGRRSEPAEVISRYSMVIHWSDEDGVFLVTLPEFGDARTHGETYEEAVRMGKELIESFMIWYRQ